MVHSRRRAVSLFAIMSGGSIMNMLTRLLVIVCLMLPFAACKKEEAPKAAAPVAVALPTSSEQKDWVAYLQYKLTPLMEGVNNSPFVYFLPKSDVEGFDGMYQRQLDKLSEDLGRGITQGNMLVFASPEPGKEVEMVEAAFPGVPPNSMKGVKVVFIGSPDLSERVKTAVAASDVTYVFVEAK